MILQLNELRDKLAGCWTGKNVGGVLGAPFECKRMIPNVDFYVQDLTQGPPANDDLDLQIVWLAAVERYGRNVNASILGEYWLSFVIPNWVEYGTGKTNLRAGLVPPLSGDVDNTYKNSNGCWIRSELWACLAPGHPEIATRYAFEDAIVDHADEGMYAEIFTSAIQSACLLYTSKTCDALFAHRNTVLYRIRRIRDDFNIPLYDPAVHADFLLGSSLLLFEEKEPDFFMNIKNNREE